MMDNTPLLKNISKSDDVLEDMAPRISHDSLESAISNGWFHADIEEGAILRSQSLSLFLTQDDRKALWITLEENPSATMFDDAQKKCFEYMEKQCYPCVFASSCWIPLVYVYVLCITFSELLCSAERCAFCWWPRLKDGGWVSGCMQEEAFGACECAGPNNASPCWGRS